MKRMIVSALLGLALTAAPSMAADAPAKKASHVATKSMMAAGGRFHRMHTEKLSLQCDTCHAGEQTDTLFLRSGETQGIGPVDRNICLDCHKSPAKHVWYDAKRTR